jgi:hypothetical protein
MFGNPRGYGKSALMMEIAHRRDEISQRNKIPSGPVLFTDFLGVKSATDAEDKVMQTIRPLFIQSFFQLHDDRGSLAFISHLYSFSDIFL